MNHAVFTDFISKSNIYATIIAILITSQILTLVNSFFDNLLSPIINSLIQKDKNTKLKDYVITVYDTDIEMGQFILVVIKFLTILFCIYYFIASEKIQIVKS
jgi:large-conductance mechanosensitive channel